MPHPFTDEEPRASRTIIRNHELPRRYDQRQKKMGTCHDFKLATLQLPTLQTQSRREKKKRVFDGMLGSVVVMMQKVPQVKGGRVFGQVCRVAPRKVFACCCETPKHSVASGALLPPALPRPTVSGPKPPIRFHWPQASVFVAPPWPGRAVAAVNNSVVSIHPMSLKS